MDKLSNSVKPEWSLDEPIFLVRLTVSMRNYPHIPDKTVYFRCRMTYNFLIRWLWYFEYLQARIKVAHPHRTVNLYVGRMDPKILLGQEFIDHRRVQLLKSRNRNLEKLVNTPYDDDLFHFTSHDVNERIRKLKSEIDALERGEITFPVLPDFVNEVKQWI